MSLGLSLQSNDTHRRFTLSNLEIPTFIIYYSALTSYYDGFIFVCGINRHTHATTWYDNANIINNPLLNRTLLETTFVTFLEQIAGNKLFTVFIFTNWSLWIIINQTSITSGVLSPDSGTFGIHFFHCHLRIVFEPNLVNSKVSKLWKWYISQVNDIYIFNKYSFSYICCF